jgi:polyhydroxybutyrate depolymerase
MLWPLTVRESPASLAPRTRLAIGLLIAACAFFVAGCAPIYSAELATPSADIVTVSHDSRSVSLDGLERNYTVVAPEFRDTGDLLPVLIAVHGAGASAERMAAYTGLSVLAQREGFIVVYPEGTIAADIEGEFSWNAGVCCGVPARTDVDDIAFIDTVIRDVLGTFAGDPQRVFIAGFSNGGMLANRIACESSEHIAGIAVVAGALSGSDCVDRQRMPVLIIHGTADATVPFAGGATNARTGARFGSWVNASVAEDTREWELTNGCASSSARVIDGSLMTVSLDECAAGTAVVLVTLEGGGHSWPTAEDSGLDASALIVDFFELASEEATLAR